MELRELLMQYEIENNLNHVEMAEKVGVSFSTYYRWMRGESTKLKKTTINKLNELLDCDVEIVIEENNRIKPILGKVKAGYDFYAQEDIEGYVEVGKADASKGDYFLRVVGNSMIDKYIFPDDLVYVEQTNNINDNEIAVILINDEVTIKTIRFKDNNIILEPANNDYETKIFTPQDVIDNNLTIIGRVRYIRRDII